MSKQDVGKVEDNPVVQALTRVGNGAVGILHILIGALAIGIGVGGGGKPDQSGAFQQLTALPGGILLLWVLVLGLFALAAWQVLQVVLAPGANPERRWLSRVKEAAKGIVYAALGVTAVTVALGGSANSASSSQNASAKTLQVPGGAFVLGLIGLVVVAIGVVFVVRGVTRSFAKAITRPPGLAGRVVIGLGVAGYTAKGVALAIVGVLYVWAAVTYDTSKAKGLDGAFTSLLQLPFGGAVIVVIALGLIAYGLFWCARAILVRL